MQNEEKSAVARRLKEVRLARKMSAADFAASIGISKGGLQHAEAGRSVGMKTLVECAAVHHVRLDWLRFGTGEMVDDRPNKIVKLREAHLLTKDDEPVGLRVMEEPAAKYGSRLPPGAITMAQALQAIADQMNVPVEQVRELVLTGLVKSEKPNPKKKG